MSATTAVAALLGAGLACGLLLIALGFRRGDIPAGAGPARWAAWWNRLRSTSPRASLAALAAGVLAGVLTGWVVGAVLAAVAAGTLPRVLGRDPDQSRRAARIEAIAVWTEMLRDTLSAAAGLEQAILATAPTAPEAIRADIGDLRVRIERGEALAGALRELADDLADPTADLVLSALVLASQYRARQLAELLGELATEAREQVAMRLRVEAGRARTRTSVRVIVTTTLAFAAGLLVLDRGYLTPYDSAVGQLMLLIVGVLFGVAFWWLGRFSRMPEAERVLTNLAVRDQREVIGS
ncbi:MAG: pilus assembly protein TadB [Pseudonocardiales bacterium]|nr:MAG: pilus assembly protein TadB [Pseudonocardiales bacterium]